MRVNQLEKLGLNEGWCPDARKAQLNCATLAYLKVMDYIWASMSETRFSMYATLLVVKSFTSEFKL